MLLHLLRQKPTPNSGGPRRVVGDPWVKVLILALHVQGAGTHHSRVRKCVSPFERCEESHNGDSGTF